MGDRGTGTVDTPKWLLFYLEILVRNPSRRKQLGPLGHMGGSRGGTGGPDPPEKSQKYRDFSNTGPDPLKITKPPSQIQ